MDKQEILSLGTDQLIAEIVKRESQDLDALTELNRDPRYLPDDEIPLSIEFNTALILSGQATREGRRLVVSDRVIDWAVKVVAKEKGNTEQAFAEVYQLLSEVEEQYQWHWLRERLPDAAIQSLISKLQSQHPKILQTVP